MRRWRWSGLWMVLLVHGCGADNPTSGDSNPVTGLAGGGAAGAGQGGAGAGGSLSGAAGGTQAGGSLSGGSLSGGSLSGGSLSGGSLSGGSPAGGSIGVTQVQQMGPCEQQTAQAGPIVPDIMIVLDRSQSMAPEISTSVNCMGADLTTAILGCSIGDQPSCDILGCSGIDCNAPPYMGTVNCGGTAKSPAVDRWTPAVQGVQQLTMQFQSKISFGLTVFPGDGGGGGPGGGGPLGNLCTPGTVRVPVGLNTASQIAQTLQNTAPTGATPTSDTLNAVLSGIKQKMSDPDAHVPPQYVLLVTDGQPTCPNSGGLTFDQQALQMDHALTVQAIDALSAAGVKTYVLGYDASVDPMLAQALSEFAMHGGTGDFHPVTDAPSIVEQFTKITATVATCSYHLDKQPADPTYVLVKLDDAKVELNTADGWVIEGQNVTIQGAACTKLKDGGTHRLVVTVECEPQAAPI